MKLEVSCALKLTTRTLNHLKKRFCHRRTVAAEPKAAGTPVRQVKFDGEFEAKLTLLACSDPPKGYKRWTGGPWQTRPLNWSSLTRSHQ